MTISSTVRIAGPYIGSGAATAFPFAFKVFAAAEMQVAKLNTTSNVETILVLNTDYTVTLNGDQNGTPGGTITLPAVLASGFNLTITSDIANLQPTDLTNQGGFYPEVITDALDRATIQIQQLDQNSRAIKIPLSDGVLDMTTPVVSARQGKYLAFDSFGLPVVSSGTGSDSALRTDLANATAVSAGSKLSGFRQTGTGATARTVDAKLKDTVSVKDFGAVGDGVTDDYAAINTAWLYCYPLGINLYFPTGTYLVVTNNFPFRNTQSPVTSLLDCKNMTIYGDGPSTILKTSSVSGADVLQLNGLKNFHVCNMQVQSEISGSASGSNGLSVTGGFDNITVDNFWANNLAYVDQTTFIDGGKAVTIQPPTETNSILMGSFKATNIFANGCVYGFGYEPDNDLALIQPVSIEVDIVVSNSRQGVVLSAATATAALSANSTSGIRIRGQIINCMQDIVISRMFGVDIDMQIIQTKSSANLLLDYNNNAWFASDTTSNVIGVTCTYAKNSRIVVHGNKQTCYNKAKIGGALDPSSGLVGATDNCSFYFGITGTATSTAVEYVDTGGNIMNNSFLYVTTSTTTTLPIQFYTISSNNTVTIGSDTRLKKIHVTGEVGWTDSDGRSVYNSQYLSSGNLSTKQISSSAGSAVIQQWLNHSSATRFAIRNDGAIMTSGRNSATSVATINNVLVIYNESNTLVGYVPIYTTYA